MIFLSEQRLAGVGSQFKGSPILFKFCKKPFSYVISGQPVSMSNCLKAFMVFGSRFICTNGPP